MIQDQLWPGWLGEIGIDFFRVELGSLFVWCMVFCSFLPFLSLFFVFHRKDLVLLNLISRCMTSTDE